jgi:MFS family permease
VSLATLDPVVLEREAVSVEQRSSEAARAANFLQKNWAVFLLVSAIVLTPCFWHHRIEAGDLGSHTYIAWLAGLVEQGRVPGLFIAHQWNNIPVDLGLSWLGPRLGFNTADKIVVSICVLTFFWGAFAFVAASTRRVPWMVAPATAMITYGFTFYAGFLNFYLSLGFALFAAAVTWRGTRTDWILGAALAALTLIAHPLGFAFLLAIVAYIHLAEAVVGRYRWLVLVAALLVVVGVHFALPHFFRTETWRGRNPLASNGADQLVLFGRAYLYLALATLVFGSYAFLISAILDEDRKRLAERIRTPIELWTILLIAAPLVPAAIWLPEYTAAVSAINSRLTSLTAILGLCILGAVAPRKWIFGGLSAIALIFFAMQYRDTGVLNSMEQQTEALVAQLPYGSKVSYTIDLGDTSRVNSRHFVDRACVGRCFAYSNYEPASNQFRVRVSPGGSNIITSPSSGSDLEHGTYVVREQDLPLYQIYQPDDADLTKLAIRPLSAGELNGRIGHRQAIE